MGTNISKNKKKIKVIAFDWGNTLGSNSDDWNHHFRKILELTGLSFDELQTGIFDKYWLQMRVGEKNSTDFWTEVYKKSRNRQSENTLEDTYYNGLWFDPQMKKIVEEIKLKNKYRLIILSNDDSQWMDIKRDKFGLDKLFDQIFVSAEIGLAKPYPEIYGHTLKELEIAAEELLFIDNELDNCQSAEVLGIKTIYFESPVKLRKVLSNLL